MLCAKVGGGLSFPGRVPVATSTRGQWGFQHQGRGARWAPREWTAGGGSCGHWEAGGGRQGPSFQKEAKEGWWPAGEERPRAGTRPGGGGSSGMGPKQHLQFGVQVLAPPRGASPRGPWASLGPAAACSPPRGLRLRGPWAEGSLAVLLA